MENIFISENANWKSKERGSEKSDTNLFPLPSRHKKAADRICFIYVLARRYL